MQKLFFFFTLVLLAGCEDPCHNQVLQEQTSPDGAFVATAFIRDCGATTDYSPQVHIHKTGKNAGRTGNVFIGNHSTEIQVEWVSATELAIVTDAETVKKLDSYMGITITKRGETK